MEKEGTTGDEHASFSFPRDIRLAIGHLTVDNGNGLEATRATDSFDHRDMAQPQLQKHVYLPVPNPNDLPKETLSKPEMLSAIIHNLDKSHQKVHDNILTAAKEKQKAQRTSPHVTNQTISTPANREAANALLLANLTAPPPSQDPCMPATGEIIPPPTSIIQDTPPPEIQLAREVYEELTAYDRHARGVRRYYQNFQDKSNQQNQDRDPRRRRSSGASIPGSSRHPPPALGLSTSGLPRTSGYGSVNASPAERVRGGPGSANASPWGSASASASPRDPRLRR